MHAAEGSPVTEKKGAAPQTLHAVVFKVGGHEHAVDVRQVKEIVVADCISPVLEAPSFVEGVIRLRGRIIPVLDLRKRLGLPPAERTHESCVIVIRRGKQRVGFLVDSASQLLRVPAQRIEPPTEMVGGVHTRFIEGLASLDDRLLMILNLREVLTVDEAELLTGEKPKGMFPGPDEPPPSPEGR